MFLDIIIVFEVFIWPPLLPCPSLSGKLPLAGANKETFVQGPGKSPSSRGPGGLRSTPSRGPQESFVQGPGRSPASRGPEGVLRPGARKESFVQGPGRRRSFSFQPDKFVEDKAQARTDVFRWVGIGKYERLQKFLSLITNIYHIESHSQIK